ncbi:MAG TPA: type II toxin-antitoxin system VapC family toxin [Candidatus Obscuribacterales bacterium]
MQKQTTKGQGRVPPEITTLLLDTHIAVWLASGSSRLKSSTLALVEDCFHRGTLCLSPISAWEIGLLVSKGKLELGQPPLVWFEGFVQKFCPQIIDISPEIAISSSNLPGTFHGDPADRILVATAIACSTAILTADNNMAAYGQQGFVRIVAC